MALDFTHDPARRCIVASAHAPGCDFTLQNLPFGVFRRQGGNDPFQGGVAIGDQALCLAEAQARGCFDGLAGQAASAAGGSTLNELLALGPPAWRALRHALVRLLDAQEPHPKAAALQAALVPLADIEHALPIRVGDFTDFYTSIHHAENGGRLRNPPVALAPNFQWMPIAYHGRSSSLGVSGERIHRPWGQARPSSDEPPVLRPCEMLDYELELGVVIGRGNARGTPVALAHAMDHVFGLTLLNDWSARDVQAWEMTPLGPFQAKNFATTLSPWIVTLDALAPFSVPWRRPADHPQPLPYLESAGHRAAGALDIELEAWLQPEGQPASRLSRTNFRHQYWSIGQMIAHHTVGGCNLRAGDLLGTGTISGPTAPEAGSLIELSRRGREPVALANSDDRRAFLHDGDRVILRGWCEAPGRARVGFGEAAGTVLAAHPAGSL
jgi:fumarylacetoacetase